MAKKKQEQNKDEDYFVWWANELIENNLAKHPLFEPVTFIVLDSLIMEVEKRLKTKTQVITKGLFKDLTWTPDFSLIVSRKLEGKLFLIIDENEPNNPAMIPDNFEGTDIYQETCLITTTNEIIDEDWVRIWFDVKPPSFALAFSSQLGSSRDFKYLQRLMFDRNKIYVNKVVMKDPKEYKVAHKANTLFNKTFLPYRYRFNDVDGKPRKLKKHESASKKILEYLTFKNVK